MMPLPDYYAILGVLPTATLDEIKQAYRRLARIYHPDLQPQITHDARIKQLNEAYHVLSDLSKRAAYDMRRLQEVRHALIMEVLRQQQEAAKREPKMTWTQGAAGFVRELKKSLREE